MKRIIIFLVGVLNFTIYPSVIDFNDWKIYTPSLSEPKSKTEFINLDYYADLKKIGELANSAHKSGKIDQIVKLFEIATPAYMTKVIDQILNDEVLLAQIQQNSYRNVTGFLKIVLVAGDSSWKIRFHVWSRGENEYPHNHKWDFYSKILTGYLTQDIYVKSEVSDATTKYIISEPVSLMPILPTGKPACPCRENYKLDKKTLGTCDLYESTGLNKISQIIIGTAESYFMSNYLIHTITPSKDAVSLVFTSEQLTPNSEVFVPEDAVDLQKYAPSISTAELIDELVRLKKILVSMPVTVKYLPEMVDLKHCYYDKKDISNLESFSRLSFQDLKPKSKVVQINHNDLSKYQVSCHDNKILIGGEFVTTKKEYLFVLLDGVMYAANKNFAHVGSDIICHTSFTDYAPVDTAGVIHFDDLGNLFKTEAYSGHYAPSLESMSLAVEHLKSLGFNNNIETCNYIDRV